MMTPRRSGPARRCGCWPTAPPRRGCRWPGTRTTAAVAGRICRRLDGIPLAIELAAARLRVMPAAELEARLDERFALLTGGSRAALPRQQTLRAMVDWSWELLTGAERAVLARAVGVRRRVRAGRGRGGRRGPGCARRRGRWGSWARWWTRAWCSSATPVPGSGRYRLLETVRQYAAGQLDALGPAAADAARIAHRDYYLALAEAAAPQLAAADQARVAGPARCRAGQPAGRDRLQPDPGRPRAGPAAGRLAAGVLAGARARRRRSRRAAGAAGRARPPSGRRCRAPGPWPRRPTSSSRRAATRSPGTTARKRWPLPAPPGTTTWSPSCCRTEPGSCCARGSPAPRCRSSSRAWTWPAASGNPT